VGGWQQRVWTGQQWGWRCACAGLVAGGVSSERCSAGSRRVCTGWEQKTAQTREWAAAGAAEETARAIRLRAKSGRSEMSGWTAAVHRVSAPVWGGFDDRGLWVANIVRRATYIILSEQVKGAEHLIVFDVKGAGGLKVALVGDERGRLDVELLGGADLAELLVVLLGRDSGGPSGAAAVVVVRVGVEVLSVVLLSTVVEELRHDYAAGDESSDEMVG
jgi:hypothetical protein